MFKTAPFPQCHAATIAESGDALVAAWFGGERERHPEVQIWVARRVNGKWSAPVAVADGVQPDGSRFPCWNPVLFQPREGPLMLFYKVGPNPRGWWGLVRTSADAGQTWSPPERLPVGIYGPVKNKPVQLASGAIVSGGSLEKGWPWGWTVLFERSVDGGRTWTQTAPLEAEGRIHGIQPSLLLHTDGRLQAVGRTASGKIFETWSSDEGCTWSPIDLLDLPNPSSGIDAVTLRDGRHLLVYNHIVWARWPLNVALSKDGRQWSAAAVLEDQPGEFSYPAVIQGRDGRVHIVYTWNRQRIKHVTLDPARMELRPIIDGRWPD